jgi:hypothetical protein
VFNVRETGIGAQILGLILMLAGYFGPWVPHKTAALTVTGFELAEFAKFFPQVQGGMASINRELFYLPLVTALILLALLAGRSALRLVRLVVPLFLAALLLVALLPYTIVDAVRQAIATHAPFAPGSQYTGQLTLVVAAVVLMLLTPLARRLPRRVWGVVLALLALSGAVPALWQFARFRPLVVALYHEPLGIGWGLVACGAGFVLLLTWGVLAAASADRSPQPVP